MKITNLKNVVFLCALIVFIASCSKDELVKKKQIESTKLQTGNEGFYSKSGILIFDNQETFNRVFNKTQKMSFEERESWEKDLGFISYDRIHGQIAIAENENDGYYTSLGEEKVNEILASGNYNKYSNVSLEFLEMGIAKEIVDENGENHLRVHEILYSSLVNNKGLVIIDNILYVFRNGEISETNDFNLNELGEIENLNLRKSLKGVDSEEISTDVTRTSGRKRIRLTETLAYSYFGSGSPRPSRIWYQVSGRAYKKNWWGSWIADYCYVITYGSFQSEDNGVTKNYSFNEEGNYGGAASTTYLKTGVGVPAYYPKIKNAVSITLRSGGCCGIGIRINNNDGANAIYVP